MTLVELMAAFFIFLLITLGVFGMMFQARRSSEVLIRKTAAVNQAQAYIEQMKSMTYADLIVSPSDDATVAASTSAYTLNTQKNESTQDPLILSGGSPQTAESILQSSATCRNEKTMDLRLYGGGSGAISFRYWIWVTDLSTEQTAQIKAITIVWAFPIAWAGRTKWYTGEIQSFRSIVPTF